MNAYPLETPLNLLSPARRVYIVRRGLVFLYPAIIVRDIANDRYTMDYDYPWSASPLDWDAGRRLSDRLPDEMDLWCHQRQQAMARTLWVTEGASPDAFTLWWESVNTDALPEWIGAAARVAARELMTFPLFKHRHLVDDLHTLT
ncbi:hypothetical protein [Xanthomonas phage BsXeu269p/3]|uniref:Uncharacterized protein n=1 Tax=Xanthomonas phage KPhi1 TaxID=1927017 RepID=A0A3G1GLC0_9CAUD|nr:hypothetical protein KEM13_gp09 [Xanthomonas phage KPhi1]APQ41888.1 hypothetical protein K1pha_9 [Xanthomonas phage KPhi1]UUW40409.1 hypothetical protein [Xanthomonas phage BsXeu269p/3]